MSEFTWAKSGTSVICVTSRSVAATVQMRLVLIDKNEQVVPSQYNNNERQRGS